MTKTESLSLVLDLNKGLYISLILSLKLCAGEPKRRRVLMTEFSGYGQK